MNTIKTIIHILTEGKDHTCEDVDCPECTKTESLEVDLDDADKSDKEKDARRKATAGDSELGESFTFDKDQFIDDKALDKDAKNSIKSVGKVVNDQPNKYILVYQKHPDGHEVHVVDMTQSHEKTMLAQGLKSGKMKIVKTKNVSLKEDVATDHPLEVPATTGGVQSVGMNGVVAAKMCDIIKDVDMTSGSPVTTYRLLLQWSSGDMKVVPDFGVPASTSVEMLADFVSDADPETKDLVMGTILRHTVRV